MSFLFAAALALGLFVVAPIAAHLLRRGRAREQEFPPAALVPVAHRSARQRARLEDRWLLIMRASLILALTFIGAVPFVRCSRLALTRDAGASVALALVIDDSLSMQTRIEDGTRFQLAMKGAADLLKSTREGDAVAIVLAARPARLLLSPTTDLSAVKQALDAIQPTHRATDLDAAVRLARSSLKALPHVDKRVAVLSDFADDARLVDAELWAPLPELRKSSADCGIVYAQRTGDGALVRVACSSAAAARGRQLRLTVAATDQPDAGAREVGSAPLDEHSGTQEVRVAVSGAVERVDAFISGSDALADDDYAPVARAQSALLIGIVADPASASTKAGDPTVVEQALSALGSSTVSDDAGVELRIQPLPLIPDDSKAFEKYAGFVIDDPPGLTPESRGALDVWLRAGGVALALLGPQVEAAQLGGSFEPFAHGALAWEQGAPGGMRKADLAFLGSAGSSLEDIAPNGRVRLQGATIPGAEVVVHWNDGAPWMLDRAVGRGRVWTFGLPSSVSRSDFALRPGFIALLDALVDQAGQNSGQRVSVAGSVWHFDDANARVTGPGGVLVARAVAQSNDEQSSGNVFTPDLLGRYRVTESRGTHERVVTVSEREILAQPLPVKQGTEGAARLQPEPAVDASREFAVLVLVFLAFELLFRLIARLRLRRENPA